MCNRCLGLACGGASQALIDCTPNPDDCGGTGGCDGATQELAFNFSVGAGITLEKDYPYQGVTGTCDPAKIVPVARITGYHTLDFNNYTEVRGGRAAIWRWLCWLTPLCRLAARCR